MRKTWQNGPILLSKYGWTREETREELPFPPFSLSFSFLAAHQGFILSWTPTKRCDINVRKGLIFLPYPGLPNYSAQMWLN
jgi:hypothetical protein